MHKRTELHITFFFFILFFNNLFLQMLPSLCYSIIKTSIRALTTNVLITATVSLGKGFGSIKKHCFRAGEPQPVIQLIDKKNLGVSLKQIRPGINISLPITNLCLPSTACQTSVVCYSRSSQLGPINVKG